MSPEQELKALREEVARLRVENAQLRGVMDQYPVGILIKDRDSRFLYVNRIGAGGFGIPAAQLIGRLERDVMPPGNDTESYLASDREVIDTGKPHVTPELLFHAHDGTSSYLHITKYPVDFAGTKAVMIVPFDLTNLKQLLAERSRLERKVLETQRLESLGVMAGGIAHDFNNLLVGVLANADLALAEPGIGANAERYIGRLKGAAQRLATLSRQMLAYSGRARFTSELLDLSSETGELLQLLEASIPKNVTVKTAFERDLPLVEVDPAQIRQVIMNLVTNAAEAIGNRPGTVTIRVEAEDFDPLEHPGLTLGADLAAGKYVRLRVDDDGGGMSARTRERLFDPFFTTKTSGRGLGLAAVLGIVRAHRGALHVCSREGYGTQFCVWLPVARASQPPQAPSEPASIERPALGTRVLVVDDEQVVRQATSAVLEVHGFCVDTADNGDHAIEALSRAPDVQAVVLDMTMPGRTVIDTHAALRKLRPGIPIVLTSGFTEQDVVRDLLRREATVFVQKPFSAQELVAIISGLLGRETRAAAG